MQLFCIDQTNGRLFFAHDFLNALEQTEYNIRLYFPENLRQIYKYLLDYFPKIGITTDLATEIKDIPQIIFTNYDNLENAREHTGALIYPVIAKGEMAKYKQFIQGMYTPVSNWAKDRVLRRNGENFLRGKRFLISAGPTVEDIDPVRYISNRSSGKMGIALARAAFINGADIDFIYGPGTTIPPDYLDVTKVKSAGEMYQSIMDIFEFVDVYIGSAAIADFTPAKQQLEKIKKKNGLPELILKPTKDVLKEISKVKKHQLVIGFSVETVDSIKNSQSKLDEKKLDMIVVNNPRDKGSAFDADTNVVSVIDKNGEVESWPIMTKFDVAVKLMHKLIGIFK